MVKRLSKRKDGESSLIPQALPLSEGGGMAIEADGYAPSASLIVRTAFESPWGSGQQQERGAGFAGNPG